jgi:hypothetical protein
VDFYPTEIEFIEKPGGPWISFTEGYSERVIRMRVSRIELYRPPGEE